MNTAWSWCIKTMLSGRGWLLGGSLDLSLYAGCGQCYKRYDNRHAYTECYKKALISAGHLYSTDNVHSTEQSKAKQATHPQVPAPRRLQCTVQHWGDEGRGRRKGWGKNKRKQSRCKLRNMLQHWHSQGKKSYIVPAQRKHTQSSHGIFTIDKTKVPRNVQSHKQASYASAP